MNWAKGRATRGRGTSFKGALRYTLHDKGASTSERVGFVELLNLATDDPNRAWSEMMALCEAADDLKKRAGIKATGRKMTKPVYAFTLNWHEADKPDAAHMRETALQALETLGMGRHQAAIIEHTDRPHKHVHVIVNLIDPDTGKAVSLSNDEHKLDRWADDYEQTQGVIRSPDRRAKFEALDNGRKPPKRGEQARTREEWLATRKARGEQAKQDAAQIKAAYADRVAGLKARQNAASESRRAEGDKLWNSYKAERNAVMDRYQPFIDAIWKNRRKAPPHPSTEQAFRDIEETAEWKELGRRQFRQRRLFDARERTMLGVIANIIRLHYARQKPSGAAGLFKLAASGSERRRQFQKVQEGEKQGLRHRQAQFRTARAETLKASRRLEIAQLSRRFEKDRTAMTDRHASELSAQRVEWRQLAADRRKAWSDHYKAFDRETPEPDLGKHNASPHSQFKKAAQRVESPRIMPPHERKLEAFRENGAEIARQKDDPAPQKGWRARRPAAERKADGSYRARDRKGDGAGRSRRRDGYELD
jgi:hypothetical protein